MARHTKEIPIIKSSNNGGQWVGPTSDLTFIPLPMVSDYLYLGIEPIGLAWDAFQIPTNKKIVSLELKLYATSSVSVGTKILKYADFGEGSYIPFPTPANKSISLSSGWNTITLDYPTPVNSVVIGIQFPMPPTVLSYMTIHSHRHSSNKPYVLVTYDDIPPEKPTSLFPNGVTVNTRDIIRFAWSHNSKEGNEQKGFELEYSTNGGSTWTKVSQTTPNQYYDLPANTLPTSGTVLWRVRTIDGNDEISEYSTASFTLGVLPQKAPIPVAPISQYLDENKPIRFEWNFLGGSPNEYQTKFDLQYSTDGGSNWTTITQTTGDNFHELPANTLSSGVVTWRVRTYNNWDEVSPWSEERSFTVIGSPPIPLIVDVTNQGRPIVTWQSVDQHLYELQIIKDEEIICNSGAIPSTTDKNFKLPIYLTDGNYKVRLRIYNEFNLFSEWAEKNFTISTVKPQKPIIEVFSGEYSVTIKLQNQGPKNLIYRDNILIGEVKGNTFIDFTGENNKEYQYFVRTVDNNDNFNDSDIKLGKCKFNGNTLALADNPKNFLKLKFGYNEKPKKSDSFSANGNLVYYDGRKYPVAEFSEFDNRTKTLTFAVKTISEVEKIIEMIAERKIFLYRDYEGTNMYGSILSISYEKVILGYEISFTITKTDYKGVAYD